MTTTDGKKPAAKPAAKKAATKRPTPAPARKTKEGKYSARKITAAERAAVAVRLKKEGMTFDEIGTALGITKQAAHQLVATYVEEAKQVAFSEAEDLLLLELEKLDMLFGAAMPGVRAGDSRSINVGRQIVMDRLKAMGLISDKTELNATVATGVFAVPLSADGSTADWEAMAAQLAEGEEAKAEELLKGKTSDGVEEGAPDAD